ncbi:mechanosensitive ion channel family protein [Orrella marina]|uniref:Mechanosensitive ion channel protein MscS n=1 Tax=Orrella marina TaxID=2163011 RepID=A0A2R4XNM5_9BURK|nr:mechanosensitive ion channel family protein [Orrella marina]AWB35410.1 mechanosensitive ion channel protein MscS [Orrella marina]
MENLSTQFAEFWRIVLDVWNSGVLGYSISDALVALGIFLVFYALKGFFRRFVFSLMGRWFEKRSRGSRTYEILTNALSGPLQLAFVTFGVFFALQYVGLRGDLSELGDRVVRTLISIAIFWSLYSLVVPLSTMLEKLDRVLTREMIDWLIKGIRWAVLFIAAATILQLWGIQVAPILAGLGLFGVAVALGAQELFRNLIGGLCILIEKQYRKGDWILVEGVVEGTVEHIGFRSTQIRRFDAAPVSVPNMKLSDAAVTNFSRMTYRRISWKIALEYRTTIDQLRIIREQIENYLQTEGSFVQPPSASLFVRIDSFNSSSIDIMLYTFTTTTVWGEWLEHKERLAYKVKEIVEGAGAKFALPSQQVYVEQLPKDVPEPFVPPADSRPASDT